MAVAFQGLGNAAGSTAAFGTLTWPTHAVGDIALLFIETTGGQPASLSVDSGFAQVPNSPQATGTTTNGTQLTVFWCRATTTSMSNPTVADSGDHQYGRIITYRGCVPSGNPWDDTNGSVKSIASTSASAPAVTTTLDNCLIVNAMSHSLDDATAQFSSVANSNLTGLTTRSDNGTTQGNGGGIIMIDGILATAGSSGATTATVTNTVNANITIALKPSVSPTVALNSPSDTATGIALQPALSFTGTDANSDAVSYEVQVDTVNTFDSTSGGAATVVDQYINTPNAQYRLGGGSGSGELIAQGYTPSASFSIPKIDLLLDKNGSPTDNVFVTIIATTVTGTVIGTSTNVASSGLSTDTTNGAIASFTFSSPVAVTSGSKYFIVLNRTVGANDFINAPEWLRDNSNGYAGGGAETRDSGAWSGEHVSNDVMFKVYRTNNVPLIDKLSASDIGFVDTTSGSGDPFNQTTLDTGVWTQFTAAGATMSYAIDGATVTFPAATTALTDGDITSNSTINLTSKGAALQVLAVPSAATSADAGFRLYIDANNWLRWVYEGGTLFAQYMVAGSKSTPFSVAYSSSTHKYWRIRHSGANVLWDTSDGTTWTNRASVATPITITALTILIAGVGTGIDANPGTFKFNDFSFGPVDPYISGDTISYTVQNANILTAGTTYYWRARAKDPSGTNTYGAWATTRSFTTTSGSTSASITQLAATVTASGSTQVIAAQISTSVTQVAANVTATGGTQIVATIQNASVTQSAASVTTSGGTQVVASSRFVSISQITGIVTMSGGVQTVASVEDSNIIQSAANVVVMGGTQTVSATATANVTQIAASVIAAGGIQDITADSGASSVSIDQIAAMTLATGGTSVITTSTGPLPRPSSKSIIFLIDGRVAARAGNNLYIPL